jgi:type I restriction enzyme R subunit
LNLNESDTRAKLIDPALHTCGWTEDLIRREETAGAIVIEGGKALKKAKGRVDYVLRVKVNSDSQPVAVALIEAKAESLPPNHGLEQAKLYACTKRLNVPYVFSSNGHLFVEFDSNTGITGAAKKINNFPSPAELRIRYEQKHGFALNSELAKPLLMKYTGGEATRRYYQDAAIRAVFEKIARGEKRALLALATGSGKTFIAVNLLKRIADAGQLKRALFVCDRDELRNQGLSAFQNVFGNNAAAVSNGNPEKNARILIATYQTLNVDTDEADASFLVKNYPENYFSHIVIDECHRSAWGKWSQVLTRNPDAIQIGLTATPRQIDFSEKTKEAQADAQISADNITYFGEPVYEYDMAQGIEDGYLAACEIQKGRVNLDDTGITVDDIIARHPTDANTGLPLTESDIRAKYEKTDFEEKLLLPDRVLAMCQDLFKYFLETGGPEQKTIIFCARDRHADDVAATMNNLYVEWCAKNNQPRLEAYAFKCTAANSGSDYLADLRGGSRHHFVAATVDLLSTGVDVPCVRNIVFFKYVNSPIAFYQMVGRGTRIDPPTGKLMFRVYDYTNATRLFGKDFWTKYQETKEKTVTEWPKPPEKIVVVEGFDVHVTPAGRYIITQVNGKAMPVTIEEYKEKLADQLIAEAPTLESFRNHWTSPAERQKLMSNMPDGGRAPLLIRELEDMQAYDLYDVMAELGYGMAPSTRVARAAAFSYKNAAWLKSLPLNTALTIKALAGQFARGGIDELENPKIFQTPEVVKSGGLPALKVFGKPVEILHKVKEKVFVA